MPQVRGIAVTSDTLAVGRLEVGICHSGGMREATSASLRSRIVCHWGGGIVIEGIGLINHTLTWLRGTLSTN